MLRLSRVETLLVEFDGDLDVDESVRAELHALTPADYTGLGAELVEELD
ncbi:hypothetical protein [Natronomonas marina]|nr:hypothetical protein [Natronomonas marina]